MNTIRLAAALLLATSSGAFARSGTAPSGSPPDQVQCSDGTVSNKTGKGACSHHGGVARTTQSATTSGAANRALPPTDRAQDNTASKSPFSIFGGKRDRDAVSSDGAVPARSKAAPQGRAAPTTTPRHGNTPATTAPTAKCRDGSASYSAHHSGACSHHGGVAQWLDGQ